MAEYDSIRENEEKVRDSLRELPSRDSVVPGDIRIDSLIPLRREQSLPQPVSRTGIQ